MGKRRTRGLAGGPLAFPAPNSPSDSEDSEIATRLDAAQRTLEELKGTIREGRELLKDLQAERKRGEQVLPMIVSRIAKRQVDAGVKAEMDRLAKDIDAAVQNKVVRICEQFDDLLDELMGRDEDRMSLDEIVDKFGPVVNIINAIMDNRVRARDVIAIPHGAAIATKEVLEGVGLNAKEDQETRKQR